MKVQSAAGDELSQLGTAVATASQGLFVGKTQSRVFHGLSSTPSAPLAPMMSSSEKTPGEQALITAELELQAKLAAMPQEELRRVLSALPREHLESALMESEISRMNPQSGG